MTSALPQEAVPIHASAPLHDLLKHANVTPLEESVVYCAKHYVWVNTRRVMAITALFLLFVLGFFAGDSDLRNTVISWLASLDYFKIFIIGTIFSIRPVDKWVDTPLDKWDYTRLDESNLRTLKRVMSDPTSKGLDLKFIVEHNARHGLIKVTCGRETQYIGCVF